MILESTMTSGAQIVALIVGVVLFGGLLLMLILAMRGAGRKSTQTEATAIGWPFTDQDPTAPVEPEAGGEPGP